MPQFLNRLLALPIAEQNTLFAELEERIAALVAEAMESGTYDRGVETIHADSLALASREPVFTHEATGAVTELCEIQRRDRLEPLTAGDALALRVEASGAAACHGGQLEGQANWRQRGSDGVLPAPPHDASGHTWHHDNRLLFDYTKLGGKALMQAQGISGFKSGMPGLGDELGDDEIWDVLAYIRSTWPKRIRELQAERNPAHD